MRNLVIGLALVGLMAGAAEASVWDHFHMGQTNFGSDNSAEFLFDRFGGTTTVDYDAVNDVGDVLLTMFEITTLEDLTGGGTKVTFGAGTPRAEWSGFAAAEVSSKVFVNNGKDGIFGTADDVYDFTFRPLTAAALGALAGDATLANINAELATWTIDGAGNLLTMLTTWSDNTPDYRRTMITGETDDGAPGDIGAGPFVTEDSLSAFTFDGTKFLEIGIPAVPVGNNLFWVADDSVHDISLFKGAPASFGGGSVNVGLDVIKNYLPGMIYLPVANYDPVANVFGNAQFAGSANLVGTGATTNTPFDAFDNMNFTFAPVPEPSAAVVWILGFGVAAAIGWFRRKRK